MGNSWSNFWVDYFQTRNCGIVGIPVRRRFWVSEPRSFEKWSASALLPEVGGSMAHGLSIFQRTDDFFNAALVISIVCQRKTKKQRANSRWLFVRVFWMADRFLIATWCRYPNWSASVDACIDLAPGVTILWRLSIRHIEFVRCQALSTRAIWTYILRHPAKIQHRTQEWHQTPIGNPLPAPFLFTISFLKEWWGRNHETNIIVTHLFTVHPL
jgi:hypothetical protein